MNRPNLFQQLLIFKISGRRAARNPCIIPTGGDAQHPTHGFDWKLGLICSHEFEDFGGTDPVSRANQRSEEHTSELQSRGHIVCRLLLEKKKKDDWTKRSLSNK